jgi:hypothetical protein
MVQGQYDRPKTYGDLLNRLTALETIEVVAFCDRLDGQMAFARHFDSRWFDERRLAVMPCALVSAWPVMAITNPHDNPACFVLAAHGFIALDRREAVRLVNAAAAALTGGIRGASPREERDGGLVTSAPFDLLGADIESIESYAAEIA